jgi:Protein of unknown function (DUF2505)
VRFDVAQTINAKRKAVLSAVADPKFYESMGSTKTLTKPEVLSRTVDGAVTHLRIRYGFAGELNRGARAILDPDKMTWVVELDVDADKRRATFRMVPDNYPDRLDSSGSYRFDKKDKATVQVMTGELKVHVPLVASTVERAIVNGLKEHLTEQAAAIERFIAEKAPEDGEEAE